MSQALALNQKPQLPRTIRPVRMIGAGGIVGDGHLPAYQRAGIPVTGICDIDRERARQRASQYNVSAVFDSQEELVRTAPGDTAFDIAVPASALGQVLEGLPDGADVLIQKPFGENFEQAQQLLAVCQRKQLTAAVNFQLRWAPYVLAARDLIERGLIGELHDLEVRVTVYTPWQLWTFLESAPRVEIVYHSIHYLDLLRSFLGEPRGVQAKTLKHPDTMKLHSTRSNLMLDYGEALRANIETNHGHKYGLRHQESYIKWEGTRGAIKARLGLLMNYPEGEDDALEYCLLEESEVNPQWQSVSLEGSWYPDGFAGTMASLQCYAEGSAEVLPTNVQDAAQTMALAEACYSASANGNTPIPEAGRP
jgi:predicted dehydrogenase